MRIVDEWNHEEIKVTAFHMNGRYSLKFELKLLEQWYKFRDGQIKNSNQLKEMLTDDFYNSLIEVFNSMDKNKSNLLHQIEDSYNFDTII